MYVRIADCKHVSLRVAIIHMLTVTFEWLTLELCVWDSTVDAVFCGVPQYYQANVGTVSVNRWWRLSSTHVATFIVICFFFMLCDVYGLQVFLNKLTGTLVMGVVSSVLNSVIFSESKYYVEINCVYFNCRVNCCFCFYGQFYHRSTNCTLYNKIMSCICLCTNPK